ncbi:hypothetical protein AGR2A_Lc180148 [Agrobacterium genomosp. 2 str. CFBP 5494]|uniref:Uncharacterized protein n=1 Tax=Agrobacterium genomosp. 2 str. CFBP 5494 TaxID=1183436 RepID=A0A9W5F1S5_9HYPH|nr:hypothetical protein AGR2A_Lc180148 [Agrobacterium genomosp. 2 str. CFBP 5494]
MALLKLRVHLAQRMHDELRRCFDEAVADDPVGRLVPEGRMIRQLAIVDDHQQIEIRTIALHRMRLVDKGAAGVGTEQDDFENAPALFEIGGALSQGILELLVQDLQRTGKLLLLSLRDMIKGGFHHGNRVWLASDCRAGLIALVVFMDLIRFATFIKWQKCPSIFRGR